MTVPWLATAWLTAFLLVTFPLRAAIGRLRHGGFARVELRGPRPRRWWIADALFVGAFTALLVGTALQGSGVLFPAIETYPIAGVLVLSAATALLMWAQETMGRSWRPAIPPADDACLVTGGPFRVVRNPNYVAMLGASLGAVALAPNAVTVAGSLALHVSLMLTARAEEPLLRARYGAAYEAYGARVGRFAPGIGLLSPRSPRA